MGKNRHSKDRLFLTATEWKGIGGKAKEASSSSSSLPFDHCALSLTRYETPCCTPEGGVIFDLLNIIPYIRKYKKNPISGETITTDDILRLTMSKNAEDKWHCPITFKVFNNNSKIVAVRTTGNVYSYEAVYELNIKTKNYVDLMNGEVFTKADIITLYDPTSPEMMKARDISSFVHLRQVREESKAEREGESSVRHNPATAFIMKEISNRQVSHPSKTYSELLASHKVEEFCEDVKRILDLQANTMDVSAGSTFTDQKASSSLTSSSVEAHTSNTTRLATVEEIRFAKWKVLRKMGKKGFVQMQTNLGNLNLEIHCDMAPRTSWNFIELCNRGYYNKTKFHRLIPGFMIQGGDPGGDGRGGMSAFGKPFKDEFDSRLLHEARGVLSMANSGPETNKSQFFITFKSAKHLDNMHTVFGRVVGGLAVLGRIEAVGSEGDKKENAPSKDIIIEAMVVFDSPYAEADELLFQQVKARMASRIMAEEKIRETPASQVEKSKLLAKASAAARDVPTPSELTGKDKSGLGASGVGKYLRGLPKAEGSLEVDSAQFKFGECVEDERRLPKKAKSNASSGFSNFSAW